MAVIGDVLGDRGHRFLAEVKDIEAFDEKGCPQLMLSQRSQHEAQAMRGGAVVGIDIIAADWRAPWVD